MMKKSIINVLLVILCVVALYINLFREQHKVVGVVCILFMGVLAILKERIK